MKKLLLLSLTAALCITGGCGEKVDPNSPKGKRRAIFKQMMHTSEDISGMYRGRLDFDAERYRKNAAQLVQLSSQPWQHFGTEDQKIAANRQQFDALARQMEQNAQRVLDNSQGDFTLKNTHADFQKVEDTCKKCHDEFRGY